jgi:DNA mismatch endonuclease (patch repair protein)
VSTPASITPGHSPAIAEMAKIEPSQAKNNSNWWREKLEANKFRDRRNTDALVGLGWEVLRFWEHDPPELVVASIVRSLDSRR